MPGRMAGMKRQRITLLVRIRRQCNTCTLLLGIQFMPPLWKTVGQFHKILKIELLYDPAIPLLGIYSKELK
jgi:hypothetical protein